MNKKLTAKHSRFAPPKALKTFLIFQKISSLTAVPIPDFTSF